MNHRLIIALALIAGCSRATPPGALDASSDTANDVMVIDADAAPPSDGDVLDIADAHDAAADVGLPDGPWRSALYPESWSPGTVDGDGRMLHDFSYAGYRYGEEPTQPALPMFAVEDYGADPTGATDSHGAFQAAVDAAALDGGIVTVGAGLFRIDELVSVNTSHVVLRGSGPQTRLWFTKSAGMGGRAHIEFRGAVTNDLEALLAEDAPNVSTTVEVADASAFVVGDDVTIGWVITPEFVAEHAMQDSWVVFNDTWQPFFRRQIVAIDTTTTPHLIELDVPLRYVARVRDSASIRREVGLLREVGIERFSIADAVLWDDAWAQPQVHVIGFHGVADAWMRDVHSFESPGAPADGPGNGAHLQNGGVIVATSKRVTVADSSLQLAQNRGGGGSGYLYEVRQSSEVLFRDLVGRAGRHNFIQNWGFGASGIVWLRVHSSEGRVFGSSTATLSGTGDSEFHHSLAMANLIDSSTFDDGFSAVNRKTESSGAGHTATQTVFWNVGGTGRVRSYQFGHGYVIGTAATLNVRTGMPQVDPDRQDEIDALGPWTDTWPEDFREGLGRGADLVPSSLYEHQRSRRQRP